MKLQILSDLHLSTGGLDCPPTDAELLVLAGDIARPARAVAWAAALQRPALYVPGNHEFYGSSLDQTVAVLKREAAGTQVWVLDDEELVIDGVRFLGSTLWTDFALFTDPGERVASIAEASRFMRDFSHIRLRQADAAVFTPDDCAKRCAVHKVWLEARLAEPFDGPTVVITHHAPSPRSIHPRFADSLINAAFVSNIEHLMGAGRVALWIHGHTHDSFDYRVNGTRVICNPRGYCRDDAVENPRFDPALKVAVTAAAGA